MSSQADSSSRRSILLHATLLLVVNEVFFLPMRAAPFSAAPIRPGPRQRFNTPSIATSNYGHPRILQTAQDSMCPPPQLPCIGYMDIAAAEEACGGLRWYVL